MPLFRLSILFAFFAFSFARAATCYDGYDDDFEIFANGESLGCDEEVSTEIIYGDPLTLSVKPDTGTYTWTTSNGTIIGTGISYSPKFLVSENPSGDITETYKVLKKGGLPKTIEITISPRETFEVSFDTDTDEMLEIESIYVMKDSLATPPTDTLTKAGYYFGGWDFDFNTPIVEDTTIKAIWKVKVYLVYFDTDGGTPNIIPQILQEGEFAKEPTDTLTKTGYVFEGWDFNFNTPITKDITIKAKWKNLFVRDTIAFQDPGFVIDANLSSEQRRYFVFSPSLCEIKDTIANKVKDSIEIHINVKEPNIALKKEDGDPLPTSDGFHFHYFHLFKNRPGLDTLIYEWFSTKNSSHLKSDTILIETPIPDTTVIGLKWNVLFVKNNPKKFTDFEWFRNNQKIGNLQFYSAGPNSTNTLNSNDTYKVVMHTTKGNRISTCEFKPPKISSEQPPNPTPKLAKQVLGINGKSLNPGSKIYDLNGKLTKETPAGVYIVKEE